MNSGLNFLVQLSTLCRQELSKGNSKDYKSKFEDILPDPLKCGTPQRDGSHRRENRGQSSELVPEKYDKSEGKKNVTTRTLKAMSSESSKLTDKGFSCAKCKFYTKSRPEYVTHVISCSEPVYVKCPECSDELRKEELDDHLMSIHLTPDVFRKTDDGSYHCLKCNVTRKYFSHFKNHLITLIHKGLDRCNSCNIVMTVKELEEHRKEVHGKNGTNYVCKICNNPYSDKNLLDRHINAVHMQKRDFKCTDCGKTFQRGDGLKRHQSVHSEPQHACSFCELNFRTKAYLKTHINNIHLKNRYQCTVCFRSFEDEYSLNNHAKIHQEGFKFVCMVCGRPFSTYSKRERHFQTHLHAPKRREKTGKVVRKGNPTEELENSDVTLRHEKIDPSLEDTRTIRKAGSLLFPVNCQKPLLEDFKVKCKTDSSVLMESMNETVGACSVSKKRKSDMKANCENESPVKKRGGKHRSSKSVFFEMSTNETTAKLDSSTIIVNDSTVESYHLGENQLLAEKECDFSKSKSERKTTKDVNLVDNLPKKDSSYFDQPNCRSAVNILVSTDSRNGGDGILNCASYETVPEVVGGGISLLGPPESVHPCLAIPEETLLIDVNNLPGVDSNIESFSSLRPDSSVAESSLIIDLDNIPQFENIEIVDLSSADSYPVKIEYYEVERVGLEADNVLTERIMFETDSVAPFCSADDLLAQHIRVETGSGISLCNDASHYGPPIRKVPAKKVPAKTSVRKKNSRTVKSKKYPDSDKKVIVKNLCSGGDDDFTLPEFVIDEDEE